MSAQMAFDLDALAADPSPPSPSDESTPAKRRPLRTDGLRDGSISHAVGRFEENGPLGYVANTAPLAPLRTRREDAAADERAWDAAGRPDLLADLPSYVHGIVSVDPLRIQCDGCGRIDEQQPGQTVAVTIIRSDIRFGHGVYDVDRHLDARLCAACCVTARAAA
ncbi:hypothetical protein QT381_02700 [Galbitalea sp. SE-J8]|uniref:hypothetical protein n=1 Tax=Galbitalea sp. SE-J8 TaxID=3054952 RepID=UPI00259D23A7|nr:hypothetical protein [Galbitalea sp. SE-J8]MDM4761913.1 hypothetical protein [Galbitalea sp. SE-J8]